MKTLLFRGTTGNGEMVHGSLLTPTGASPFYAIQNSKGGDKFVEQNSVEIKMGDVWLNYQTLCHVLQKTYLVPLTEEISMTVEFKVPHNTRPFYQSFGGHGIHKDIIGLLPSASETKLAIIKFILESE